MEQTGNKPENCPKSVFGQTKADGEHVAGIITNRQDWLQKQNTGNTIFAKILYEK
jgi:hypothetical protein